MKRFGTISLITLFVLSTMLLPSCEVKKNTVPTALFIINPAFGSVDSVFTFDASEVHDLEDLSEDLLVRWDWESDSIFDTEYSTNKVELHQFPAGGTYYITMEVQDTKGLTARTTDFLRVAWTNRAPNARFVVMPETGFLQDVFIFDASSSSDVEDNNQSLLIRWDFNGDGSWDTEYNTEKQAEHQYETAGEYEVMLEVKDSEDLTSTSTYTLVVGGTNVAPEAPQNVAPTPDYSTQSTKCLLEWTCTDPDQDILVFDVYFGAGDNLVLIASDVEGFSHLCLPLEFTNDYSWKVVAKDPYEHEVSSEVWHFSTWSPDYEMSQVRDPRDGKFYKTININGQLWMAENMNSGTMIKASDGGDYNDGYQKDNNKQEKYCYKDNEKNCDIYGALYQWDEGMGFSEAIRAQGICPTGWHVPDTDEWEQLRLYFEDKLGKSAGENLIWGGKSGFEMLFSGFLIFAERKFYDLGSAGYAWSSTINPEINHLSMARSLFDGKFDFQEDTFQRVSGLPVRCLKNY